MEAWLKKNPAAREFIDLWLKMAVEGKSDWTLTTIHKELINEYGMPVHKKTHNLRQWMISEFGPRFTHADEATR